MLKVARARTRTAEQKRYRMAIARQCADAILADALPPCTGHRHRPSCSKCTARQAALKSARTVLEVGGVPIPPALQDGGQSAP